MFKDISYLVVWRLLCSVERKHLCHFGKGHYEEHFCEIILNSDQWFRRCCLKGFLSTALVALRLGRVEPFCAILVEGIMGNISVKLF